MHLHYELLIMMSWVRIAQAATSEVPTSPHCHRRAPSVQSDAGLSMASDESGMFFHPTT
jgi:hypothetical protein